jgi:NADPH-dependent 7-cyano-7-deazaguanine reductase QueF
MEIIHKTKMEACCPNGGHLNKYEISIKVPSFVEVEKLEKVLKSFEGKKIFQEDLIVDVAKKIHEDCFSSIQSRQVGIIMEGEHLGFHTTTIYEYPETPY